MAVNVDSARQVSQWQNPVGKGLEGLQVLSISILSNSMIQSRFR